MCRIRWPDGPVRTRRSGPGRHLPCPVSAHPGADTSDPLGSSRGIPAGHVPVRRLTLARLAQFPTLEDFFRKPPWRGQGEMETLHRAVNAPVGALPLQNRYHSHAAQYGRVGVDIFSGAGSWMSVWDPNPGQAQFSLSQLWIVATDTNGGALQTIEGGWIVNPVRYPSGGGKPILFIFMTANDYGLEDNDPSQSGWNGYLGNMSLPGDVTTQSYFALSPNQSFRYRIGEPLDPQSTVGGPQYGFRMQWQRNPETMDWWLFVGSGDPDDMEAIGVIPSRFFNGGPLVQADRAANVVDFGGEEQNIQTPPAVTSSTPRSGAGCSPSKVFPEPPSRS